MLVGDGNVTASRTRAATLRREAAHKSLFRAPSSRYMSLLHSSGVLCRRRRRLAAASLNIGRVAAA